MSSKSADVQVQSIMAELGDDPSLESYQAALRTVITVISAEIAVKFGIAIAYRHGGPGPYWVKPGPFPCDPVLDLANYALSLRDPAKPAPPTAS